MKKRINFLATEEDIALLREEIARSNEKKEHFKADIIKWMFIFWIAQIGATIGLISLFLKK